VSTVEKQVDLLNSPIPEKIFLRAKSGSQTSNTVKPPHCLTTLSHKYSRDEIRKNKSLDIDVCQ